MYEYVGSEWSTVSNILLLPFHRRWNPNHEVVTLQGSDRAIVPLSWYAKTTEETQ